MPRRRRLYAKNYVPPHKRYPREGGFFAGLRQGLLLIGAWIVRVLALPFRALAGLFAGKTRANAPAAAPANAPAAVPAQGVSAPRGGPWRRVADIGLLLAVVLSAGYMLWAVVYSDTALTLTLTKAGHTRTILTKAQSVEELLAQNGIVLKEGEALQGASLSDPIEDGMALYVTSDFPVAVASGGEVTVLYMQDGSVGDALAKAGVTYDADDEITKLIYEDVAPGMHIQHIDVKVEYDTQDKVLEFKEETIKDSSRYIGNDTIKVQGEDGERRIVRRLVYKDGVLSSREIMNQITLKQSVTQVKVVGTKIRYQTSFTGDERIWKPKPTEAEIKKTIVATEVTAYTHTGNRTATGRWPKIGYVAVNPNVIPYGTKLYIPGYGYCTARDTGAFRHEEGGMKNQIDIFLNTEKECRKWGRKRNVTVYILK